MDRMSNSPRITTTVEGKIEDKSGRKKSGIHFMKRLMEVTGVRTYRELKRNMEKCGRTKEMREISMSV